LKAALRTAGLKVAPAKKTQGAAEAPRREPSAGPEKLDRIRSCGLFCIPVGK
jgi:hypothetical protein